MRRHTCIKTSKWHGFGDCASCVATLMIYIQDESTSIPLECQVTLGALHRIEVSS
ncbi:hypothetical protein V6Z11_D01G121800 [Gossypium hirsutum]